MQQGMCASASLASLLLSVWVHAMGSWWTEKCLQPSGLLQLRSYLQQKTGCIQYYDSHQKDVLWLFSLAGMLSLVLTRLSAKEVQQRSRVTIKF